MKCWGVESGALARPHAELPGGKALSPSSPSSRPEPLELEERRRGTDRLFWPRAFSEAWGQSWEVAVLWGQVESQGLALGPTPWRSGVGAGFSASLPPAPQLGSVSVSSGGAETGANGAQPAVPAWTTLGNRKWEGCTQQVRAPLKGTAGAGA